MAHAPMPLAELLKINDASISDIVVSDLLRSAPVIEALPAVPASAGTVHKYNKLTTEPAVGFRDLNDGRDHDHTQRTTVSVDLKILDASFHVDAAGMTPEQRAAEARSHLRSAFAKLEKQLFYGAAAPGDTSGCSGIGDNADYDGLSDDMVADAGGSTASVQTSVYFLRATDDETGVATVFGNNGEIMIGEEYKTLMAGATGSFPAWATDISAYAGFQLGSKYSVGRLANVESTLTDALIYEAMASFKADMDPTHIVMNRKARRLLQASRTATNATGAPAPRPTEVEGIPILVTDQIVNTEAVVA